MARTEALVYKKPSHSVIADPKKGTRSEGWDLFGIRVPDLPKVDLPKIELPKVDIPFIGKVDLQDAADTVIKPITDAADHIVNAVKPVTNNIQPVINKINDIVVKPIVDVVADVVDSAKDSAEDFANAAGSAIGSIGAKVGEVVDLISDTDLGLDGGSSGETITVEELDYIDTEEDEELEGGTVIDPDTQVVAYIVVGFVLITGFGLALAHWARSRKGY